MFKVENAGTSIDQKRNHAWNCSSIKVRYMASIFQLKARVKTQKIKAKKSISKLKKNEFGHCRACITSKLNSKNMNNTSD